MKICIATDAWSPQINGVVTTLQRTAATLRGWGHDVLIISPDQFTTVPCPTYPEIRLALTRSATIRRMLTKWQPDAVHIATEGPLGWATRSACRRLGLLFTTSYHTRFPEYLRMRFPIPLHCSYGVLRYFHCSAARTMAAPTIIDELKNRGFQHLTPWSRGVDLQLFRPYRRTSLCTLQPRFVYVGRVSPEKNLPAFLNLDLPGEKWVIGEGPDLGKLRQDYPRVRFTGGKQGEALAHMISAADVFVFPSRTDTFGIVLLEANACGVPVAAYPVTGPQFLIREGINGCLDTDLRAAALRALSLSRDACRQAVTSYSWESCSRQFLNNLVINPATVSLVRTCMIRG